MSIGTLRNKKSRKNGRIMRVPTRIQSILQQ